MSDPESAAIHFGGDLTAEQSAVLQKRFEETAARARAHVSPPGTACHRTFGTGEQAGTCTDCGHAVIAHIGTGSCVICRMEHTLTPQWRQQQARIHGLDYRRIV